MKPVLRILNADVEMEIFPDGSVRCKNDGLDPVYISWANGQITVVGRTHFRGTPQIQQHAMLDVVTTEALDENTIGAVYDQLS